MDISDSLLPRLSWLLFLLLTDLLLAFFVAVPPPIQPDLLGTSSSWLSYFLLALLEAFLEAFFAAVPLLICISYCTTDATFFFCFGSSSSSPPWSYNRGIEWVVCACSFRLICLSILAGSVFIRGVTFYFPMLIVAGLKSSEGFGWWCRYLKKALVAESGEVFDITNY